MDRSRRVVLAFSLCATAVCALITGTAAAADGGTISFVGAIVAPTCSIASESSSLTAAAGEALVNRPARRSCAATVGSTANSASIYSLSVKRLSSAEPDRVLAYFDSYVKASRPNADDPVLVTQTYE